MNTIASIIPDHVREKMYRDSESYSYIGQTSNADGTDPSFLEKNSSTIGNILGGALGGIFGGSAASTSPTQPQVIVTPASNNNTTIIIVAVVLFLLLAIGMFFALRKKK